DPVAGGELHAALHLLLAFGGWDAAEARARPLTRIRNLADRHVDAAGCVEARTAPDDPNALSKGARLQILARLVGVEGDGAGASVITYGRGIRRPLLVTLDEAGTALILVGEHGHQQHGDEREGDHDDAEHRPQPDPALLPHTRILRLP